MARPVKCEVFPTENGQWSYRFRAANGRVLATSETYTRKATATRLATNLCEALRLNWTRPVTVVD